MRCAKGICAKGFGGCTRFSLLRWEKGSETPSRGGKRGLRLPRSSCSDLGNEGVSDPFFHRKRESSDPFLPPQKGNLVHPPNPLAQIPLAQSMNFTGWPRNRTGTGSRNRRNRFPRNRTRNRNRRNRFAGTETGTGTVLSAKLYWNTQKLPPSRTRRNRKPEPLEPDHPQTVTEPNRTGATLIYR